MSMKKISLSVALALAWAVSPAVADAYFTTSQTAVPLNERAAMFLIEYSFGLPDHDLYMPVIAQRGLEWESTQKKLGYTFAENESHVHEHGTAAALVVSDAPIVNGMYKIEKGTAKTMTLLAFLITNPQQHEEDYALQVTRLPYYVDKGAGELEALQLNPSELQYYVTKEIELNTGNFN